MSRINCLQCKHYYSTWDKYVPRGCKVYGLKSKQIPSVLVKQESGSDCMSFEKRVSLQKKDKLDNLNDPSLW